MNMRDTVGIIAAQEASASLFLSPEKGISRNAGVVISTERPVRPSIQKIRGLQDESIKMVLDVREAEEALVEPRGDLLLRGGYGVKAVGDV